jgi:hypothetical protein
VRDQTNTMSKPKLFFSYSHKDKLLIDQVRYLLLERENLIFSDHELKIGDDFSAAIFEQIKQADYFVIFLSPDYLSSVAATSELNRIMGYAQTSFSKVILPVLIRDAQVPTDISKMLYLNCVGDTAETIAIKIEQSITRVEGRKEAEKERAAERIEKINTSISDHIEPILKDLKEREDKLRRISSNWNFLGYISIVIGIIASVVLVVIDTQFHLDIDIQRVVYLAIKGAILLILLLTSSKYAFTLSKSYMNESLKNADRIHAISFGKFYIKVFEGSINANDFKEIFQNWNLSTTSSFSALSTDSYDPKIIDSIGKVLEALKDNAKK